MGIDKTPLHKIAHLDNSLLIWLIFQVIKEIYDDSEDPTTLTNALIKLKKDISDIDYNLKLKFQPKHNNERDLPLNITIEKSTNTDELPANSWMEQIGKLLLNCENSAQYKDLNNSIQSLLTFIENEINPVKIPKSRSKLTKYSAQEMALLIKLLEQQEILRGGGVMNGTFISEFSGIAKRTITDSLSDILLNPKELNQEHLKRIEKDLKVILDTISELKYPKQE